MVLWRFALKVCWIAAMFQKEEIVMKWVPFKLVYQPLIFFFHFIWRKVDYFQCYVSFWYTGKWFSYTESDSVIYTCIVLFSNSFPIDLLQNIEAELITWHNSHVGFSRHNVAYVHVNPKLPISISHLYPKSFPTGNISCSSLWVHFVDEFCFIFSVLYKWYMILSSLHLV